MLSSVLSVKQCVVCQAVWCPNKEELTRAAKQLLPLLATLDCPSLILLHQRNVDLAAWQHDLPTQMTKCRQT